MQRLEYSEQGRNGHIIYKDKQSTIKFYYEFGGGNCVAIIFIPDDNEWTTKVNRSLSEKATILKFIAEQVIKDKAPGCCYKLSEVWVEIFKK